MSHPPPADISLPRRVAAGNGWRWIVQAFYLVREQPLTWLLFSVSYLLLQLLLGGLPWLGQWLVLCVTPLFAGGFVMAAARADRGETLRPGDVFDGFRRCGGPLFGLGLAYIGLLLLAMLLLMLLLMALVGGMGSGGMQALPLGRQLVGLALLLLGVFVATLLYWFAPAAVALAGDDPLRAMRRSLAGGLANWPALLLCSASMTMLLLLAVLPFGLGLLLWLPVMLVAVYMAWQDVFGDGLPAR